jgi:O-antigen/teichoic acid export membrane protein
MKIFTKVLLVTLVAKVLKFSFEIGTTFIVSPDTYGLFSILISYILILSKIGTFGIPNILIRDYPKFIKIKDKSLLLQSSLIVVILVVVILYLITTVFKVNLFNEYPIIFFISLTSSLLIVSSTYIRSIGNTGIWIFLQDILWYFIYFLVVYLFYLNGILNVNINQLLNIYSGSILTAFLFVLAFLRFTHKITFNVKLSSKKMYLIISESFPVLFTGLTYLILARIDVIMLNNHIEINEVGDYNKVVRIAVQILFFHQIISSYFYPRLAKKFTSSDSYNSIAMYNTKFLFYTSLSTIFLGVMLYVLIVFFDLFDFLNITSNKINLYYVVLVFIITQILYSSISTYGYILLFLNKQKIQYINNLVILILGISLNYFLIPLYGMLGASVASAFSILLGSILEVIFVKYYTNNLYIKFR